MRKSQFIAYFFWFVGYVWYKHGFTFRKGSLCLEFHRHCLSSPLDSITYRCFGYRPPYPLGWGLLGEEADQGEKSIIQTRGLSQKGAAPSRKGGNVTFKAYTMEQPTLLPQGQTISDLSESVWTLKYLLQSGLLHWQPRKPWSVGIEIVERITSPSILSYPFFCHTRSKEAANYIFSRRMW